MKSAFEQYGQYILAVISASAMIGISWAAFHYVMGPYITLWLNRVM